jgi:alpha-L-rhamnosidase
MPRTLSTIDARAGRYVLIAVWGSGPIRLRNLSVYEERYPLAQRGSFHSSSPLLDTIWQVGVDTAIPNMTDAYADPWRERGQWWGDAHVIDHVNRVSMGDTGLLRRGLQYMANVYTKGRAPGAAPNNNATNMLDYSMLWVSDLAEYFQQTGERQLLFETFPKVRQLMEQLAGYENAQTGLIDLPQAHWSETVYIELAGYDSRFGQSTAVNALYYHTLLSAASIADQVDSAAALAWRQRADSVRQSVNTVLYLPSERRYLTTIYQGVSYPPTPQAQAWALAYGLAPQSEVDPVASALLELISPNPTAPNVEIYGLFWVLEGLGQTGRIPEALGIIENYYGYLIEQGAKTWWERFDANRYQWASLSHGWGGAPTWFLSAYVLGARPVGPDRWLVRPALQGLPEASGTLPLQKGELQVAWQRISCQKAALQLTASQSTSGEILLPPGDGTLVLTLNEQVIWKDGEARAGNVTASPDGIHIHLESGSYSLNIHQDCP